MAMLAPSALLGGHGTDTAVGGDGTDFCRAETAFDCENRPAAASDGRLRAVLVWRPR